MSYQCGAKDLFSVRNQCLDFLDLAVKEYSSKDKVISFWPALSFFFFFFFNTFSVLNFTFS